ncbi:MAG: DegT/DnrJ/EryC1/StrS family aminotransferase [Candidatus Omnitrophica bacterium]|nr:DegT/DnrJ/EryC1/StrS family aminotransferase [Candidatus Omnitrophota bacterium]
MTNYEKLIPVSRPSIGRDELAGIDEVFKTGWLGLGKWVFEFENVIKDYIGARNVIAVNTGTTALHLGLDALGVERGDEVIVPSLTFAASIQAIVLCGARPVFCEVSADTLNVDVSDIKRKINSRTKAIMPVHYCGLPCDMDAILDIARRNKLKVVEDAAHAFGSTYKGKKVGSFGDLTCFSFDPIKNITCGEGGAITTSDDELAQLIYKKRILGIDKDTWSRYKHKRDWFYNVTTLGFRYHMSNINAAIGLAQFKKLHRFIARKKEIVKIYDRQLGKIKGLKLLKKDYINTAPFNYIIRIEKNRDALMDFLKKEGIDSGVHYIPNHLQPFFKRYSLSLPVTEKVWQEIITLPLYSDMTDGDVLRVISGINKFFKRQ